MPEFMPALDQTLEPEAIVLREDLEERTRKLGNTSLGPEDLG
jgi:hypothetical protein